MRSSLRPNPVRARDLPRSHEAPTPPGPNGREGTGYEVGA